MATSLREALESAVSSQEAKESSLVVAPEAVVVDPALVESVKPASTEVPIGESAEAKAERLRDDKGRFVEGKPETKAPEIKPAAAQTPVPVVAKLSKPDSWKKDKQADWDALTPSQQAYVKEREDQYFKGISTYQQEWKGAKPLLDAVAPFLSELQKHNISPETWITNLGRAHQTLALGDAQSKLQMFAKLAQEYGVPLQALYDPAFAQQFVQQTIQQPAQRPAPQQADIAMLVKQELLTARTQDAIEQFEAVKDAAGQPMYPHFQTVKSDMALLLDAGKAQDLKSAYSMALRLHDDLWAAEQLAKGKADEAVRLEANRKAVAAAKGSAVSVKSDSPASAGAAPKKGIRSQLEDAYDTHMSGRV
jgi:hypothetical protein